MGEYARVFPYFGIAGVKGDGLAVGHVHTAFWALGMSAVDLLYVESTYKVKPASAFV